MAGGEERPQSSKDRLCLALKPLGLLFRTHHWIFTLAISDVNELLGASLWSKGLGGQIEPLFLPVTISWGVSHTTQSKGHALQCPT